MDQFGRYISPANGVTPARDLFDNFPLPTESDVLKVWIHKPIEGIIKDYTGFSVETNEQLYSTPQFNKVVRELVKLGVSQLKSAGKTLNENTEAVLIFGDTNENSMSFVYTNWRSNKTNENKISKIFDWSTAEVGFSKTIEGGKPSPIFKVPKKPKDFVVICYGMGRRGDTWKGGRIVLTD